MFFYYNVKEDRPINCEIDDFNYLYKTDKKIVSIKQINEHIEQQAIKNFRIENRKGELLFCLIKDWFYYLVKTFKVL